MTIWHGERGKKLTGGKIVLHRKKRKYELGGFPTHAAIGKEAKKLVETKSNIIKVKSTSVEFANVLDKKTNAVKRVKILDVIENPANPHYVRQKIITKGTIVKTEIGNAKITSRPSQHGVVNAIIIQPVEQKEKPE